MKEGGKTNSSRIAEPVTAHDGDDTVEGSGGELLPGKGRKS